MTNKTIIISGFPGIGKTTFAKDKKRVLDLDSSRFSKIETRDGKNPFFPENYVNMISMLHESEKFDYILVSTHDEVRAALKEAGLVYTLVYPEQRLAGEYFDRYRRDNRDPGFVNFMMDHWDDFIRSISRDEYGQHWKLKANQYLSDVIADDMDTPKNHKLTVLKKQPKTTEVTLRCSCGSDNVQFFKQFTEGDYAHDCLDCGTRYILNQFYPYRFTDHDTWIEEIEHSVTGPAWNKPSEPKEIPSVKWLTNTDLGNGAKIELSDELKKKLKELSAYTYREESGDVWNTAKKLLTTTPELSAKEAFTLAEFAYSEIKPLEPIVHTSKFSWLKDTDGDSTEPDAPDGMPEEELRIAASLIQSAKKEETFYRVFVDGERTFFGTMAQVGEHLKDVKGAKSISILIAKRDN